MSLCVSKNDLVQLSQLEQDGFLELGDLPSLRRVIESVPGWSNEWAAKVRATAGGMTNVVVLIEFQCGPILVGGFGAAHCYIVRIRSAFSTQDTNVLVDLSHERNVALLASEQGIGPKCMFEFANGRVEECIRGQQVSSGRMRESDVATGVAEALADFHVTMYDALFTYSGVQSFIENPPLEEGAGVAGVSFWERITGWLTWIQVGGDEEIKGALEGVESEIVILEKIVDSWDAHIGYCHNDLQCGNMLLVTQQDKTFVRLIDYEYATVGDICFDIANHFCEYAADYESDASAAILDWTKLPSRKQAIFFCRAYVAHLFKSKNLTTDRPGTLCKAIETSGRDFQFGKDQHLSEFDEEGESACHHMASELPDFLDAAAVVLYKKSYDFEALSHLQWALWGFIQHCISTIDFDFLRYGHDRLDRYHETKQRILAQRHR